MKKELEQLKKTAIFSDFSEEMLEEFGAAFTGKDYKAGEIVFKEGSTADSLFVITSGEVVIEKGLDTEGKAFKQLATLVTGEFFGEMALLSKSRRFAQARVMQDAVLYEIGREDFFSFVKTNPENGVAIFTEFMRVVTRRLQNTSNELTMLFDMSALVMAEHKSASEFISRTLEEISIYFEGKWNFYGFVYNRFNEEFEPAGNKEAFTRPAPALPQAAAVKNGWFEEGAYLMPFKSGSRLGGCVVFSAQNPPGEQEKRTLAVIFNTISSIMGSAVENIEARVEAGLMEKLKSQKYNL